MQLPFLVAKLIIKKHLHLIFKAPNLQALQDLSPDEAHSLRLKVDLAFGKLILQTAVPATQSPLKLILYFLLSNISSQEMANR